MKNCKAETAPQVFQRQPEMALEGSNLDEDLTEKAASVVYGTDQMLQTYQVPVGLTPTPVAIRPDTFCSVENLGAIDVYLGGNNVSVGNGILLVGIKGKAIKFKGKADIYAIAASAVSIAVVVGSEVDFAN